MKKLFKSPEAVSTFPAIVSAILLTLAIGGCGNVTTEPTSSTSTGSSTTGASSSSSFTVTPGAYERRAINSTSGKISFTVTGIDMDLDKDAWPIVYFYDDRGYTGGRGGGGFNGELRNYKLKYYGTSGAIESESYHGYVFRSNLSYDVILEWKSGDDGYVKSTVNGVEFSKPGGVGSEFTLGIGWPPAVRNGWDGAVYTNIVWPSGSTSVE